MNTIPGFFSKKNNRKISSFIGLELLYDYLSKNLDSERTKAMDELISQSRELGDEIKSIKKSLNYLESLSETQISATLSNRIQAPTSYYQGLLKKVKFTEWPVGIKLGIEALFVSALIFSSIIMIPWHRINNMNFMSSREILLVELEHEKPKTNIASPSESEISPKSVNNESTTAAVTFQDEGSNSKAAVIEKPILADAKPVIPDFKLDSIKAAPLQAPTPTPKLVAAANPPASQLPAQPVKATPEKSVVEKPDIKTGTGQGFLYRGVISVSNLTATSQKFVDKISSLGGRRAGEVELGWKKGGENYFHFTIPEAKYETLTAYLNEYGKLKIQREKHERVLPDGIIRLIITVSEDKRHP